MTGGSHFASDIPFVLEGEGQRISAKPAAADGPKHNHAEVLSVLRTRLRRAKRLHRRGESRANSTSMVAAMRRLIALTALSAATLRSDAPRAPEQQEERRAERAAGTCNHCRARCAIHSLLYEPSDYGAAAETAAAMDAGREVVDGTVRLPQLLVKVHKVELHSGP
jgi:hypothetical protein